LTQYNASTYYVDMNITLSVDQDLVERARKTARAMGKSLNQVIRDHLAYLAGEGEMEAELNELRKLSLEAGGRSGGRRIDREELHGRS
jgi:hypothetical protein